MRSFVFSVVALLAVNVAADTLIQYPMAAVQDAAPVGLFRNRQNRLIPQPGAPAPPAAPGTDGNRTAPVDPNVPPKFDPAPSGESTPLSLTAFTPEQKQQLFTAISSLISLILGAFAGSGKASPFLSAILLAFKGIASPAPAPATPVRTRIRAARARAKPKPLAVSPETK